MVEERVMRRDRKDQSGRFAETAAKRSIQAVLAECQDAECLFELYYFSREPAMLEIMRAVAALPDEARASLEAFFSMAHDPEGIAAHWDARGSLTLASPQIGQTVAIMRYCAENEDGEAAPLPN